MFYKLAEIGPVKDMLKMFSDVTGIGKPRKDTWGDYMRAKKAELKAAMKPRSDEEMGYYIGQPGDIRIVPVRVQGLIETLARRKGEEELSAGRLRECERSAAENNRLMEMMHVRIDEQGRLLLVEGNHRLSLLDRQGMAVTLVYLSGADYRSVEALNEAADQVHARCGVEDASVTVERGAYVYCGIEYDIRGGSLVPVNYDERYRGAYYKPPSAPRREP